MERLTKRCGDTVLIADSIDGNHDACEVIDILAARLAAYEDTGLAPEEVNALKLYSMGKVLAEVKAFDGIPLNRLTELAQAEKDGRLKIVKKPPEGECCGNCADFIRTAGMASGTCRTQYRKRGGRTGAHRRVSQSTKACAAFADSKETEAAL